MCKKFRHETPYLREGDEVSVASTEEGDGTGNVQAVLKENQVFARSGSFQLITN